MRLILMLLALAASGATPPAVVPPEVKPPVIHTYIYVYPPAYLQKKMDEEMLRKLYEHDQRNPQRRTKLI